MVIKSYWDVVFSGNKFNENTKEEWWFDTLTATEKSYYVLCMVAYSLVLFN
jgi:hypothetical protein